MDRWWTKYFAWYEREGYLENEAMVKRKLKEEEELLESTRENEERERRDMFQEDLRCIQTRAFETTSRRLRMMMMMMSDDA